MPASVLDNYYGDCLIVRPPPPVTLNKAGANYKSEIAHLEYSPLAAYDEWLGICDAIATAGGDAIFQFEENDEAFLDAGSLQVDSAGTITNAAGQSLGTVDDVMTGRVFSANGPWAICDGTSLRALMPNLVGHRNQENRYYTEILETVAKATDLVYQESRVTAKWEGMADVAVVGDSVIFTFTVSGHYDQGLSAKTMRSQRQGVEEAAAFAGLVPEQCLFVELVYPHFHGDTVHFGVRTQAGPKLMHFAGGLWGSGAQAVSDFLGADRIVAIAKEDAADNYASNSRQVAGSLLVPEDASEQFSDSAQRLGLSVLPVRLHELFGKAGGGPACTTLYLPSNLHLPEDFPLRYSVQRQSALERRERLAEKLWVDAEFFYQRARG